MPELNGRCVGFGEVGETGEDVIDRIALSRDTIVNYSKPIIRISDCGEIKKLTRKEMFGEE